MTPEELSDIDKQVAEAIGLEHSVCGSGVLRTRQPGGHIRVLFTPSTDWNDAMFAAEKVKMLSDGYVFGKESYTQENLYFVAQHACGDYGYNPIGRGETGPLAICNFILKLKGKA